MRRYEIVRISDREDRKRLLVVSRDYADPDIYVEIAAFVDTSAGYRAARSYIAEVQERQELLGRER